MARLGRPSWAALMDAGLLKLDVAKLLELLEQQHCSRDGGKTTMCGLAIVVGWEIRPNVVVSPPESRREQAALHAMLDRVDPEGGGDRVRASRGVEARSL